MIKKIVFVFVIKLLFLIILGVVAINKLFALADLNNKFYKHPFAVTNATKTIESNIISIYGYMKDIVFSTDMRDIAIAKEHITASQILIGDKFEIVFKQYLGDRDDVQKAYNSFLAWEPMRDKVITLMEEGKKEEALALTKIGTQHVETLNLQINNLVDYADYKAKTFYQNSLDIQKNAILTISVLLGLILLISFFLFIGLIRSIFIRDKKIKEYFSLIDQNIMSVMFDRECKIIEVSSAMSKFMQLTKEELLATPNYFLLSDCPEDERLHIAQIMHDGETWSGDIQKNINGELKWLHLVLHPAIEDKNKYTNILNDITIHKKVEEISRRDALTNIYNRGYFDKIFPDMIKISKRNKTLLAFAMIDIDYFKQYNDTYGHQEGDKTLIKVAQTLNTYLNRPDDYIFRIGGEEFAMLFYTKMEKSAYSIGKKLIKKVENLKIAHSSSDVSDYVTISMGMVIIKPDESDNVDEFYKKVDDLLYKAKDRGRNNLQV